MCVAAPLLRAAWHKRTKGTDGALPDKVYIGQSGKHWRVAWEPEPTADRPYDLSVRDRVLFGSFTPGLEFAVDITSTGALNILTSWPTKSSTAPSRQKSVKKTSVARKSVKTSISRLEADIEKELRPVAAEVLRTSFRGVSLLELSKVRPDLTVKELMGE